MLDQMHKIIGSNNPVPRLRSTVARSDEDEKKQRQNYKRREDDWHDKEFGVKWRMSEDTRKNARALCDSWKR